MNKITLVRIKTSDEGTLGKIEFQGHVFFTLELPWRNNLPDFSCIPSGSYRCDFTYSNRFKKRLYLVGPVDGRTGIRIHSANLAGDSTKGFVKQLNGCIALGKTQGEIKEQDAILRSKEAVEEFHELLKGESFILEIKDETKEGA